MQKMRVKLASIFFFFFFLFSSTAAFNITKLLGQYPEFGAFNEFLTKTKISDQINRRQTITVLALDNATFAPLSGKPLDVITDILSDHVVLDFFGIPKIKRLLENKKSSILTTLYQTSGQAVNQQGFLNVSFDADGDIAFGSGAKGSPLVAKLVKSVAAQPYNISVLQVSAPIVAPGIDPNPSPPPPPAPKKTPPPKKSPAEAPGPSDEDADGPVADTPADAPEAESPEADAPGSSDSPASSPPKPADDDDEAPAPSKSGSTRAQVASAVVCVGMMTSLLSFFKAL